MYKTLSRAKLHLREMRETDPSARQRQWLDYRSYAGRTANAATRINGALCAKRPHIRLIFTLIPIPFAIARAELDVSDVNTHYPNQRASARRRTARHGLSSVLAMLFLVLFSTLAVGFYTSSTMSSQIARNQQSLALAQAGAEAGMQYMRYQFNQMTIPPNPPNLLNSVATALGSPSPAGLGMNGTSVMNGNSVTVTNNSIYIPSQNGWSNIDSTTGISTKFRAVITTSGQFVICTVEGGGGNATIKKAIQLKYQTAPKAGTILDYGVASAGTVTTAGSTFIKGATDPTKGSVLSADMVSSTPISVTGIAVSGDVSVVNPSASIVVGASTSIGGTTDPTQFPQHEHYGVPAPTFPWIDPTPFLNAANASPTPMTAYVPGQTTLTNVIIPPNTNPKFTGGATINGLLLIQTPNVVTFKGNANVNGVIVTDTTGSYDGVNNQIIFGGTVTSTPVSTLNPATFGTLPQLTGSFLLAPNYAISFTGNFGTLNGSIVAGTVNMSGNATGTVDGSLIAMHDSSGSGSASSVYVNGSADIIISSTGTTNYPTGMSFGNSYTPLPGTYIEVVPW
jgi:Tfp pilus assembly protein PilX